jgi:hypothetical protein
MPLFPTKDRTIRLTLETFAPDGSSQGTPASQPRYVSQFIPNSGLLGGLVSLISKGTPETTLDLIGPTSIDIAFSADVAAEPGLETSYIQPWFIKPIPITIKGTSYIGAYTGLARADRDAKGILQKFRRAQNDFSDLGGKPGNSARLLLELVGMPYGMSRFLGHIKDFTITESVDKAYLLNYTLSFIGRNIDDAKVRIGKGGGKTAYEAMGGR